jgi:hypothetical protein
MGVITAAPTVSSALSYNPQSLVDRSTATGDLWSMVWLTATTFGVYRSTDGGGSWSLSTTITRANVSAMGEFRIDQAGDHIHWVWLANESSFDRLYYKRIDIRSGTAVPGGDLLVAQNANGGVANAVYQTCGVWPQKNPDGTFALVVPVTFHTGTISGVNLYGVSLTTEASGFTTYVNPGIILNKSQYAVTANDTSLTLSIDAEHNGDGITTSTPNLWISWQAVQTLYAIKLSWQGYQTGWSAPTSATSIALNRVSTLRDGSARWTASLFSMLSPNTADQTKLDMFDRNQANTTTVSHTTPSHPQGVITAYMLSQNHVTGDPRLFAVGTSTAFPYYIDYARAGNAFGSWTIAYATTAPRNGQWGIRRSSVGTSAYEFYQQEGAASPYTVRTVTLPVNFAPTAPTWVYGGAGSPAVNGAAFDVSVSLVLDWQFNDANVADTQGSYALSRQIGAATIQYWRASDSTWQAAEVQNTSATTALTLTTAQWLGAGGATDPAHVYKVKTWDSAGLPSTYSDGLSIIPSTRVDPTLTHPTAAEVFTVSQITATWTISEQSAYRITVSNTVTGLTIHDSGWQRDPGGASPAVLSYTVPVNLSNSFAGSLTLQSRNVEGLPSVVRSNSFTVAFVEPVSPVIGALSAALVGGLTAGISVPMTQAAPTGAQPTTTGIDIYRRKVVSTAAINSNPYFETNANDWTAVGGGSVARSTAQFHEGAASLLYTPPGAVAAPFAQTGLYPVTQGVIYEARTWTRPTTANKPVRLYLSWYDVSSVLVSSTIRDFAAVAGVWMWGNVQGAPPSTATQVRVAVGLMNTPAATDTAFFDETILLLGNIDAGTRWFTNTVSGTTYTDFKTVTGVDYEYQAVAAGGNATTTAGPWKS